MRACAGSASRRTIVFYDEHVEADAVHEQVVRHGVVAPLLVAEPALAADVVFGVRASSFLADRFGDALLDAWTQGRSALRVPLPDDHLPDPLPDDLPDGTALVGSAR